MTNEPGVTTDVSTFQESVYKITTILSTYAAVSLSWIELQVVKFSKFFVQQKFIFCR